MGSLLLSSGSWCVQNFVCALHNWGVCFSQSCGRPVIKSFWPWRPDSLGIPGPFFRSLGWEAWHEVQNLHNSARTSLVLLFSSLWVTNLAGMGFDFIMIAPLLPSYWASLSSNVGYLFLVGSSVLLLMAVQQLVAILVLSQEEMSTRPSTPPSWTRSSRLFNLSTAQGL